MKDNKIVKISKVIDTLANKETKLGKKLREIAFETQMSKEDRKSIKEDKKYLKKVNKIIDGVNKSKIYDKDRKKLFYKRICSAKGHFENQTKIIKQKYIEE